MIQLDRAHHVRFAVPDLEACEQFCLDFGLLVACREPDRVFMKGVGGDAYSFVAERGPTTGLLGIGLAVRDESDLERAMAAGGGAIRDLDGPGGGKAVILWDPDGLPLELVHGVATVDPIPLRQDVRYNTGSDKARRGARQLQPDPSPPQIIRFGHMGLLVTDYQRSVDWYGKTFGLRLTDGVYAGPDQTPLAGFFRLDRGDEWVDHHSLAFFAGKQAGPQHISFEVQDVEAQMLAHEHLTRQGYSPLWGLGRHALGSHVFDVWWEPNDIRFETFTDTDLWTAQRPGEMVEAHIGLTRWGPQMPAEYIMPRGTPGWLGAPSDD